MSVSQQKNSSRGTFVPASSAAPVSAIIPARNEESVIATCIESLARQQEISEIVVVDDQSTDGTAGNVRKPIGTYPHLRLFETARLPHGWGGQKYAPLTRG